MRAQASIYCERLNAALGYAQACGEYLCKFCVRVREHGHSLHLGDEECDEKRGAGTPPPESGDRADAFVVVPPSTSL